MLISIIEGDDLRNLLIALNDADYRGLGSLRIHQESDGSVKYKINGGMWTRSLGGIDPSSDLAVRRREVEEGRIRVLTELASAPEIDVERYKS